MQFMGSLFVTPVIPHLCPLRMEKQPSKVLAASQRNFESFYPAFVTRVAY